MSRRAGQSRRMDELTGFASTLSDLLGLRMIEWRDGLACIACDLRPHHLNRAQIVHGGILLTLIDEVGAAAGVWCATPGHGRHSVTVNLNGHFTGRAGGGRIVASGTMVSHGRSLYHSRTEVVDGQGNLLAFGSSTHRWRTGDNRKEGTPVG